MCGQLLRPVLIPCHVEGEPYQWTCTTALSFAAEIDGHVLGTLCAVTMALLTNRLDLCIQGLFGAGKSKSMAVLILVARPPVGGVWAHRQVSGGPRT